MNPTAIVIGMDASLAVVTAVATWALAHAGHERLAFAVFVIGLVIISGGTKVRWKDPEK